MSYLFLFAACGSLGFILGPNVISAVVYIWEKKVWSDDRVMLPFMCVVALLALTFTIIYFVKVIQLTNQRMDALASKLAEIDARTSLSRELFSSPKKTSTTTTAAAREAAEEREFHVNWEDMQTFTEGRLQIVFDTPYRFAWSSSSSEEAPGAPRKADLPEARPSVKNLNPRALDFDEDEANIFSGDRS